MAWATIGVIGGMGPLATADFVRRLAVAVGPVGDAGQPRVLVDSNPHVPDRNAAAAGRGASPGPVLAAMARGLERAGAAVLAMPCNAAHGWAADIRAATALPLVDIVDAAVAVAVAARQGQGQGPRRVGLLAVGATLDLRLYDDRLAARGAAVLAPDRAALAGLVARIKAGDTSPAVATAMAGLAEMLVAAGADTIIAACTEVPLVLDARRVSVPFVDATAALVAATLAAARRG